MAIWQGTLWVGNAGKVVEKVVEAAGFHQSLSVVQSPFGAGKVE